MIPLKTIWENRSQISEGLLNTLVKTEHVETIARQRLAICESNVCGSYTQNDAGCLVPGTTPCCDKNTGGCGCSLYLKIRSLSSSCPKNYWPAELSQNDEAALHHFLSKNPDTPSDDGRPVS